MKKKSILLISLLCAFCFHGHAQIISTIAGNGTGGFAGDGGLAISAELNYPYSVSSDNLGNLLIPDPGNVRVRKESIYGIISTIAGTGAYGYTGDGGQATAAEITWIAGTAVDAAGNIYLCGYEDNRVRKISPSGVISNFAGTGSRSFGGDGGPATAADLSYPYGIAVDGSGNLYITDYGNYRIRKVNASGIISTVVGNGTYGYSGDGGAATAAEISSSLGIASDSAGNLFIADYGNAVIRKVNTSGIISTIAGHGYGFSGDGGPATAASMGRCYSVAVDKIGNIYIGDNENARIRKVDTAGIIRTIAGNGTVGFSGDLGPATAAELNGPTGVSVDALGNVYIADYGNNRVRMIWGGNHPPHFVHGHRQTITICADTVAFPIDSMLSVVDSDFWQTETWHSILGPSHGTVSDSFVAVSYGGLTLTPVGKYYRTTGNYSGTDSFKVSINDGALYDTTTFVVTINPPVYISGSANLCLGVSKTLIDSSSGGTWSSSNTAVATVGSSSGSAFGVAIGTARITYSLSSTGCRVSALVTVNPLPAAIGGSINVCVGAITTLTDASGGGAWTSGNTAVAGAGSSTGNITGVATGTTQITYTLPTGCIATTSLLVNPVPAAITGTHYLCVGTSATLSDATTGGSWTSSSTFASAGSGSGVVTGVIRGSATITYSLATGCFATTSVAVNAVPMYISGSSEICAGGTTTLTDDSTGGTWSSGDLSIAMVGLSSGIVTGMAAGTGLISYILPTTCFTTKVMTIDPFSAGAITPEPVVVCPGSTVALSEDSTGGTWSSSNPAIGSISTGGVVTGISNGHTIISYTISNSCGARSALAMVTVGSPTASTFAGNGTAAYSGDGGPATAAEFFFPIDVFTDASGNTYVCDMDNNRVRKINSTGIVTTIAGNGTAGYSGDGVAATATKLYFPDGICLDGSGNLYISDDYNNRIRKVNTSGIISTFAGTGTFGYTGDGGLATNATINAPRGIIADAAGNIYFADLYNNAVREITTSGYIKTIAGTGTAGFSGDGGPATAAELYDVAGLTFDAVGNLYLADGNNYRIRKVTAAGIISTVAGNGTSTYGGDGLAATATGIALAQGVFADAAGNLIISSWSTNEVRLVNTSGIISTIAGTGAAGSTGDGGPATAAKFNYPQYSWVNASGDIYVADMNNNRIRKISVVNPVVDTIIGLSVLCSGSNISLADSTPGGSWSSSTTAIATVGTSGVVTGVTGGTVVISYSVPAPCSAAIATKTITVNQSPAAITGSTSACLGSVYNYTDAMSGGTWTSSNTATGTIGLTTGVLTALATGTTIITYTLPTGCLNRTTILVNGIPSAISGLSTVCAGSSITLTDGTGGGTWSSSSGSIAIVGSSSGIVSGISSGTSLISYILSTGCNAVSGVSVNTSPSPISGATTLCAGSVTSLSDLASAGTWASSNLATGTVGLTTGVFSAVSDGTTIITYTLPGSCFSTTTITVNTSPSAIGGPSNVCSGSSVTCSDGVGGGAWSSSLVTVATVGASSGIVTGVSSGTAMISYSLSSGCFATTNFTVNASPSAISGSATLCAGSTTALSDLVTGGTWSSYNMATGTIGLTSGVFAAISAGTSTISYTLPSGCSASVIVTVTGAPSAISGISILCSGNSTLYTDGVTGGSWSSSSVSVATVGSLSGTVTGISSGTAVITYSLGTGCMTTQNLTVNTSPSAITGTTVLCAGATTALSDLVSGGTWTSSNIATGTIGSTTGVFAAISAGTSTISYVLPSGCSASVIVTATGAPSAISGVSPLCAGSSILYTDGVTGGRWTSSSISVATVGSVSGTVTGISSGTVIITYSLGTGCMITQNLTVNTSPSAITGTTVLCAGVTTTLNDLASGGTWSSSNTAMGTIELTTGVFAAISAGTSAISYVLPSGCSASVIVTVTRTPLPISGISTFCAGSSTLYADGVTGGSWSSSSVSVATVGSVSGTVTGLSSGTAMITYSLGTGCLVTKNVTINTSPSAITGITALCAGSTTALNDLVSGGTWSSSDTATGTIGLSSGFFAAISAGTSTISYVLPSGCSASIEVTVTGAPSAISGLSPLCAGSSTLYTDGVTGGSWSSSLVSVATVGSISGTVTGVSAGTATITYSLGTGCLVTKNVTINTTPSAVTGTTVLCAGSTTTLNDLVSGGMWSSSNPAIGTVGLTTGIFASVSAGTSAISYTLPSGCSASVVVTVTDAPSAISGISTLCTGSSATFTDGGSGGSWSSSSVSIATAGSVSGSVTGVSAGTAVITYSLGSGCFVTKLVTINASPSAITGGATLCAGGASILNDLVIGGTWSSNNVATGTIGVTSGVFTAISSGTTIITYTLASGCNATALIAVAGAPSAITGPANVCSGSSATFTDAAGGGTWSSSDILVAGAGSLSGVITGISAGTAIITYSLGTGCLTTKLVTVNPSPSAIIGTTTTCVGGTVTLSDPVTGGTWTSGSAAVGTIGLTTGIFSAITTGTSVVSYVLSATGCTTSIPVTVLLTPGLISGSDSVCVGSIATLINSLTGGTWSTSGICASIGLTTGILTGSTAGTEIITYSLGTGCSVTTSVTVVPPPSPISGSLHLCAGMTTLLTDASLGGTWSSGASGIAAVGTSGRVTGVTAGTAAITYTAGGCQTRSILTVNPLPAAIGGARNACAGLSSLLTDATTGGTWSSSNISIATIGSLSGISRGVSGGVDTITYTASTGCTATITLTVSATPLPVSGPGTVCVDAHITLTDAVAGGTWSSNAISIATVSGTGVVTGVAVGTAVVTYSIGGCAVEHEILVNRLPAPIVGRDSMCEGLATMAVHDADSAYGAWTSSFVTIDTTGLVLSYGVGVATITYSLGTGCYVTKSITINPLPGVVTGGVPYLCIGASATYTDVVPGGLWSTTTASIATIGSLTGRVTGIATGNSIITYTIPTGCFVTRTIAVNPQPAQIEGLAGLCAGTSATFTDSVAGGVWSSMAAGIASVGSATGVLTAVSAGVTTISYSVTNLCGTSSATKTITVYPLPPAGLISGGSPDLCIGVPVTLSETIAGGVWAVTNGMATLAGTVVTGLAAGPDTVIYTVVNTWCTNRAYRILNIHPIPDPGIITGDTSVCQGATTTLTDAVGAGTWSSWNTDATVATGGLVTGVIPGMDTIYYTVSNDYCLASAKAVIHIDPLPNAGAITGPVTLCVGDSVTLQGDQLSGTWGGNTAIITISGGVVKGLKPGIATITYSVTNSCGNAMTTHTISVYPQPDAGIISGIENFCAGDSIHLSETVPGGIWVSENSSVCTISSGEVNGVAPGIDMVSYEVTNSCGTAVAQFNLNVYPAPNFPVITQSVKLVKVSSDYATYQWEQSGKSIPGATSDVYAYSPFATYQALVTNSYGCLAVSQPYTAVDCTPDEIGIFPNPATSELNILWCKSVTAIITTIDGRKIKTVENTYIVDLGDLPNAEYMIEMYDVNGNKLKAKQFSKISR